MEWVIQLECRLGDKVLHRRDVATISRESTPLLPEHVGLTLRDGKTVLNAVQRAVITDQVEVEAAAWWICPHCQQRKRIKDRRQRRVRSTFGEVVVCCRRYHHCTCVGGRPRIEWPLRRALPARSTPEFAYLLATWGSRMPYRRAATLLRALLPLRRSDVSYGSVRRCTLDTGRRIENRAIDRDEYEWENTGRRPVTPAEDVQVAIDGTWIRAAPGAYGRQLHVVAGRIARDGALGGHFAWVPEAVGATGAMMQSALDDDGCTSHSRLEVIADGADGLESVVRAAAERPPSQRLDWFHLSMRLRPIEQMVDRVAALIPMQSAVARSSTMRRGCAGSCGMGGGVMRCGVPTNSVVPYGRPRPRLAPTAIGFDASYVTSWACGGIFAAIPTCSSTMLRRGAKAVGFPPPWPNRA
jgi:hypothetical protein